jgi:hypothetical protein
VGRANIANAGKRFSSEYQPASRGRKKGVPNRKTMLRQFLRDELDAAAHEIDQICLIVFGPKEARKMRKRSIENLNKFFYGSY